MTYLVFVPLVIASLMPWQPQPGDARLVQGAAFVVEQDAHHVAGWLPTPCHEVRIDGERVYSVVEPDGVCVQTMTWFEVVK